MAICGQKIPLRIENDFNCVFADKTQNSKQFFFLNFNWLVFKGLQGYIVVNRLNTLVKFNKITLSSSTYVSHFSILHFQTSVELKSGVHAGLSSHSHMEGKLAERSCSSSFPSLRFSSLSTSTVQSSAATLVGGKQSNKQTENSASFFCGIH